MSKHNETGKEGEITAQHFLVKKGYKILDVNWRYNHKEIDIVAVKNRTVIFVEVKTRSTLAFELPQEAVTVKKQKNLIYAADAYIQEKELEMPSQFDIVAVLAKDPPEILEHLEDAFQPNELF